MSKCELCNDSGFVQGVDVAGKHPADNIVYTTVRPCSCRVQQTVSTKVEYVPPKSKKQWWEETR